MGVNVPVGGTVSFPSATCTDAEDGNITYSIETGGAGRIDTSRPGTYYIYYCGDSAGNKVVDAVVVNVNP